MIGWLFPPAPLRRLLPDQQRRAAPWIVGLVTFVSMVVGAAGLAVLGASSSLGAASADRWSLQVSGSAVQMSQAEAFVRRAPEVADVAIVPEAEVRSTLRNWLGPAAETLDLPLPMLADVTLRPGADGQTLANRLAQAAPGARLAPWAEDLHPLRASLQALSWLAIGLLLVLAVAMAAAVTLAARATLEANRSTLDILHGIGATDAQLLGLAQRRIALDALVGGLAGGVAAALILLLAALPARDMFESVGGRGLLSVRDLLLLALLPVIQAVLATLVARRALGKALRASP